MKTLKAILILLLLASSAHAQDTSISIMTYNIRCGFCEPQDSPNHWSKRKFLLAHLIKTNNPDILALQEAERFQIDDLIAMLEEYQWVGVGRDDGDRRGEANAVFFRKSRLQLESSKTLWLSPTPEKISRGWDAAFNRTLTQVALKDTQTNQLWHIFNTHLDHQGVIAQKEGAKLLLAQIKKVSAQIPLVVTGDFNVDSANPVYQYLEKSPLIADAASFFKPDNSITFNDFGKESSANKKIDYIFVNKSISVLSHKIDQTRYNDLYPSDHYPIIVLLKPAQPIKK